jgi:NTP pyrophosphatase (non-canonical NTP hydrolase)
LPSSNSEELSYEKRVKNRQLQPLNVAEINAMAFEAYWNSDAHGFHETGIPPFAEMIALVHSEASEALEEHRAGKGDYYQREDGKPMGIGPELADIIIRVGHLAFARGINLEEMVRQVQKFNRTRPHKHGKKY